jgi:hypothetical protein
MNFLLTLLEAFSAQISSNMASLKTCKKIFLDVSQMCHTKTTFKDQSLLAVMLDSIATYPLTSSAPFSGYRPL